ncbi:aspartate carbamoyltransferase catalytic subunit [candidate division KSB1 bacterium]
MNKKKNVFNRRHLLGLEGFKGEEITHILDTALSFREVIERPIKKVPTLTGVTVVNCFFEPSTRTRISFELAEKRLSADSVNFASSGSSTSKGETLRDTVRNIEAMKIDMVVIRHPSPGVPLFLTKVLDASIINAGDGSHEHPTQGLLDIYSMREKVGDLKGARVCLIGDIKHGRVPLSNIYGLQSLGAEVAVCGPPTLMPLYIKDLGVKVFYNVEDALQFADIMNVLRIQLERQKGGLFPTLREYHEQFGITRKRLDKYKKDWVIMHPGPINRGVEIETEVADGDYSIILDQVTNGVAIRMAVLYLLSGREIE